MRKTIPPMLKKKLEQILLEMENSNDDVITTYVYLEDLCGANEVFPCDGCVFYGNLTGCTVVSMCRQLCGEVTTPAQLYCDVTELLSQIEVYDE